MDIKRQILEWLTKPFNHNFCHHPWLNMVNGKVFCHICSEFVQIHWGFVYCKFCDHRHIPTLDRLDKLKPKYETCSFCGQSGYYVRIRDQIKPSELPYALCLKSKWNPDSGHTVRGHQKEYSSWVEADVIQKREFRGFQSVFDVSPFQWQAPYNPSKPKAYRQFCNFTAVNGYQRFYQPKKSS